MQNKMDKQFLSGRGLKNVIIKCTCFFLLIMITLTFFSKTIRYYTTTKVTSSKIRGGNLSWKYNINIEKFYEGEKFILFPLKFVNPLLISSIDVKVGDEVSIGDTIMTFDKHCFDKEREIYLSKIKDLNNELKLFDLAQVKDEIDYDYIIKLEELKKTLTEIDNKILIGDYEEDKDIRRTLNHDLDFLIDELNLLKEKFESKLNLYNKGLEPLSTVNDIKTEMNKKEKEIAFKQEEIDGLDEKALNKLKETRKGIAGEIEKLNRTQQYKQLKDNKESEIFERKLIVEKIIDANSELASFDKIINLDAKWVANRSYKITETLLKEGETFLGMQPVIKYIDINSIPQYQAEVTKIQFDDIKSNQLCIASVNGENLEFMVYSKKIDNQKYYILLSPPSEVSEYTSNYINSSNNKFTTTVSILSPFYNMIIPNQSIVQQRYIYAIENKTSFFGEEQFIQKIEIEIIDSDDKYTAINLEGDKNITIVNLWSGLLFEGDSVIQIENNDNLN